MEKAVTIVHKKMRREFIISSKTKPQSFRTLVKKALALHSEVKYLKTPDSRFKLEELIAKGPSGQYQVVLQDESSEQRPLSEVCSQKNMSRVSGRKNPPSEKELLDSKFYIDDFQLFMSEVSGFKNNKFFGIVFFNSRKRASFLGKKILRELIFEFDRIEFFYALHPIKMHTGSALLGEVLVFSLFRGKRMLHEREFPEQITAADQILNYIKNLVRLGEISFEAEVRRPKNLIQVQEQRSFDQKIENSPEKLSDFGGRPNRTAEIIKSKPVTPDKDTRSRRVFAHPKPDSPIKSPITNQISFESDSYQPDWFFEGHALNRLEKGVLSALIKVNESALLTFLNGLNLKATNKEPLNIKLVKVYLQEFIDQKFAHFTPQQRKAIQLNQQNRKSMVFTALLKLSKFGDFKDFVSTVSKELAKWQEQGQQSQAKAVKYSSIAKNTDKSKASFTIKLVDCERDQEAKSPLSQICSPFRHSQRVRNEHSAIASRFHKKALEPTAPALLKEIEFQSHFNQAQRAGICDLICKNDAFMIECFIRNAERGKKTEKMSPKIVKKYLREVESRYGQIRERTVLNFQLQLKMHKLEVFHGLIYYLYKLRFINKKQLKISLYLYTWSDLNILAAFELYLHDRNLEELVDTLYSIDYNYYLHGLYEIDHSEVQHFTYQIQSQLIILFLYEEEIHSGEERTSLQKFIRAGDVSLLKLYSNLGISNEEMIKGIVSLGREKTEELINLNRKDSIRQRSEREQKKERCDFAEQILANRYKHFQKKELLRQCLNQNQPTITDMFDRLDSTNDQHHWLNSFAQYIEDFDEIHRNFLFQQFGKEANFDLQKLKECGADTIKGIYQAYLLTNDKEDTIDSLQRAIRKQTRANSH